MVLISATSCEFVAMPEYFVTAPIEIGRPLSVRENAKANEYERSRNFHVSPIALEQG